jgi:predicted phosphodiesterase
MKLLLIADIHANYEAFQTVLETPHDKAICFGDIVDYGPDPDKCIDLLLKKAIPTIKGNHDNAVAFKVNCQCGYKYKHLSVATMEYTWKVLDNSRIEYLQKLPLLIKEEIEEKRLYVTHASPRSMFEYIKPETPDEEIQNKIIVL